MPGYKGAIDLSDKGLLNRKQAAERLGFSMSTFSRYLNSKLCTQLTRKHIVYSGSDRKTQYFRVADIDAFKNSDWFQRD